MKRAHSILASVGTRGFERLEDRRLLVIDPTAQEQYMLELLNRMRQNPADELFFMTNTLGNPATSLDPDINAALQFFRTSGTILAQQWTKLTPTGPLAWHESLYDAAEGHNEAMILGDEQSHQVTSVGELPLGTRITNAGYTGWTNLAENIYAFAHSTLHAHAGFAIDWGGDPDDPNTTGIQDPPGHREDMMNPIFREVGIRILEPGNVPGHDVGPIVVTQDFGRRSGQRAYLLGVAYADVSRNGFYEPGEGRGGVLVTATANDGFGASFSTTTMTAGGWQMQLAAGTYAVTFSGGVFGAGVTYRGVLVGGTGAQNTKLDGVLGIAPPNPVIQILAPNGAPVANGDMSPTRAEGTNVGNSNLTNQVINAVFTVRNTGNLPLQLSGTPRVFLTGANLSDFTLTMDAPATIAAGDTRTFTIRFDPSMLGPRTAMVTIVSNDLNNSTFTFMIQGHGIQRPVEVVSGNQVDIAAGDTTPTTADWTKFAGIDAVYGTKVRIFTIENIGLKPLTFSGATPVQISGPSASRFVVFVQPAVATLNPGQSTQFRVRFTPGGQVGFANATITIFSNDGANPAYSFAIQGNGLALPRMQVSGGGVAIAPGDATPSLADKTDWGPVAVTSSGRARLFTITNVGLAPLVLTGSMRVRITGTDAAQFRVSAQPSTGTIAPGASVTFKVVFDPAATGIFGATVVIDTNENVNLSPSRGQYTFAISGVAV